MSVMLTVFLTFVASCVHGLDLRQSKQEDYDIRLLKLEKRLEEQDRVIRYQNQRIQTLEKNDEELRNAFRNTVIDMNTKITLNENELTRLRNKIVILTKRDIKNQRALLFLRYVINGIRNRENEELDQDVNINNMTAMTGHDGPKVRLTDIPMSGNLHRRITTIRVAFYAYMSANENNPGTHHTLIFDVKTTDVGGGYNENTGIFTVPVDGIYAFSYSVRVYCNAYAIVQIIKTGNAVGAIIADSVQTCENDMTFGMIVISAVKGDTVFVRTHATTTGKGHIISDVNGYTSFCGWLIA